MLSNIYPWFLIKCYGVHIGKNVKISWRSELDRSNNPKGIWIGDNSWILAGVMILSHDYCKGKNGKDCLLDTRIGANTVIGCRSVIMGGVTIGDHVVIGAGSVIVKDIPSNSVAIGNPARVIRSGVIVGDNGQIIDEGNPIQ